MNTLQLAACDVLDRAENLIQPKKAADDPAADRPYPNLLALLHH